MVSNVVVVRFKLILSQTLYKASCQFRFCASYIVDSYLPVNVNIIMLVSNMTVTHLNTDLVDIGPTKTHEVIPLHEFFLD